MVILPHCQCQVPVVIMLSLIGSNRSVRRFLWISGILLFCTSPVIADSTDRDDKPRLTLKVGQIYFNSMEGSFLADNDGGPLSTTIDFSRDLDIDDSEGSYLLEGIYYFNPVHRVDFSYYNIERSGERRIDREITFGDETYVVNTLVDSQFDAETLILTYSYLFYSSEEVDLGLTAGLHITEADLSLKANIGDVSESATQTAPLPVGGILLNYDISDKWTLHYQTRVFLLDYDDYRGSLNDTKLTFEYEINRDFGLEFGFNRRDSELEVKESGSLERFDSIAQGWIANIVWNIR